MRAAVKPALAALALAVIAAVPWAAWYASGVAIGPHETWRLQRLNPATFGIVPNNVWYKSLDGTPIQAWWLQPRDGPSRKGTIVVAHGCQGNRTDQSMVIGLLLYDGYNVIAPDLRGHGASGGWYMTSGYKEALDILGAIRFARARGDAGPFGAFGYSYGGVAALYAAAQSAEIKAVACDSAFLSGSDLLRRAAKQVLTKPGDLPQDYRRRAWLAAQPGLAWLTFGMFRLRTGVPFDGGGLLEAVSHIRSAHVMLLAAHDDPYVPLEMPKRILASVASPDKQLVVELGEVHSAIGGDARQYLQTLGAFFDESMQQSPSVVPATD